MSLPVFDPRHDPGPSFAELLSRTAPDTFGRTGPGGPGHPDALGAAQLSVPHGTTIAALRYDSGVVMVGDRRATEGVSIAHRGIEKVFPADRFSAVAIAGAAGPAIEMVRLFQTQLEHYEKVEGSALSLEGKANQLSQMIRANLPMAMQGFVVLPLFAGWDTRRQVGRIFTYDFTGGRYEETDFHAIGSGGRDAKTTIKLGFREDLSREEGIELAVEALYQAADEDAATGGPDPVRGIYPIVATVDASGFSRLDDEQVARRFVAVLARRREQGVEPARGGGRPPVLEEPLDPPPAGGGATGGARR